jgi:hypothetical protein
VVHRPHHQVLGGGGGVRVGAQQRGHGYTEQRETTSTEEGEAECRSLARINYLRQLQQDQSQQRSQGHPAQGHSLHSPQLSHDVRDP